MKHCPRCQRPLADEETLGSSHVCHANYDGPMASSVAPDELCSIIAVIYARGLVDGETIAREHAYAVRGRDRDDDSVCFDEAEAELKRCLEACR